MSRTTKLLVAAAIVVAGLGAGTGIVLATSDDDHAETPITGTELGRASAAALEHTGGGRVTETEAGDEDSYYEVEVTLDDGRQVDVQLDRESRVVGSETDGEDAGGDG